MFAILEIGGKQYKVAPEQKLKVDNLNQEVGQKITFDKIFCIKSEDGKTTIGEPVISGAKIEAEVISNFRDDKVLIFKKRRRKNSRRKRGHRQYKTEIKILSIKA
jgi:large subunit ribosomal protein L21